MEPGVEYAERMKELKLDITPEIARGTYANLAIITHTRDEFILDFALAYPRQSPTVGARVITSPRHAKALLRSLEDNVRRFEERNGELSELVGTEVEVRVTEVDRDRDRVVVSRRDVLRSQRRAEERSAFDQLEVGTTVNGRVVAMTDYGALVDLAGARGLLHRTEMSWSRVARMEDHAQPGQDLDLVVIEVNRPKRRIGLSLRRLADDPLPSLEEGTVSDAVISRLVDYGAFAELPSGLEGLVHLSEMAEGRGFRPEELVAPGELVRVMVVGIDRKRRRLDLSMTRAAMAAP